MNWCAVKNVCFLTVLFLIISVCFLKFPKSCYAEEYELVVDVSPNIINIASQRVGSIRIFTAFRYATYINEGNAVFVYFNESESVENIYTTRDSLGNLILKFSLDDLLALGDSLDADEDNDVQVVITMDNGDEYIGDTMVELVDKNGQ